MATHESIDRLSYETRHLADVVAQSAGLWRDQASEHIHKRYLRPHASAAAGILEGLAEQDEHDSAASNHAEEAYGYQQQAFAVVEVVNAEVDRAKRHEQSAHSFLDQTLRHEQTVGQIETKFRSLIDQANHSCNGCPGHAGQVAPSVVLPRRVDQLASVPTPQSSASAEADFARATGRNYGAAAELTVGGRKFVRTSDEAGPSVGSLHPAMQEVLDRVPEGQQSKTHGKCAEIWAISDALHEGIDPSGGSIHATQIGDRGRLKHGDTKGNCSSCSWVRKEFGIAHA